MSERLRTVAYKALKIRDKIKEERGAPTTTYKLDDGRYYTEVNPDVASQLKSYGYNPFGKVVRLHSLPNLNPGILKSEALVHEKEKNKGFITPSIGDEGNINLWEYFQRFQTPADDPIHPIPGPKFDLAPKTMVISNLENIVASEPRIVFPDICSGGNVIVDSKGNPYIVDIGGMQVEEITADGITKNKLDHIINGTDFKNKDKYIDTSKMPNLHFKKELDKASMVVLYFAITFGVYLENYFAQINDSRKREEIIDCLFKQIGLGNEYDLAQKLLRIYEPTGENEWLGSTVADIADKYRIERYYEKIVNPQTPWIITLKEKRKAIRR